MKYRIIIIFFIGVSSISGCMGWCDMAWWYSYHTPTRQYQISDLVGEYKVNWHCSKRETPLVKTGPDEYGCNIVEWWQGEGTLYLNADGTYLQTNKLKCPETGEEKVEENKGHWKVLDNKVYFSNEMVLYDLTRSGDIERQHNMEIVLYIFEERWSWSKEFILEISSSEGGSCYVKYK